MKHAKDLESVVRIEGGAAAFATQTEFTGLSLINGSFSHYVVDRRFIDALGYFDERLLGFGEEDGDIVFRILKRGQTYDSLRVDGVTNMVSPIRNETIKMGSHRGVAHKYSQFNRSFILRQKYAADPASPLQGMFDGPMRQILEDLPILPGESFFWKHRDELFTDPPALPPPQP